MAGPSLASTPAPLHPCPSTPHGLHLCPALFAPANTPTDCFQASPIFQVSCSETLDAGPLSVPCEQVLRWLALISGIRAQVRSAHQGSQYTWTRRVTQAGGKPHGWEARPGYQLRVTERNPVPCTSPEPKAQDSDPPNKPWHILGRYQPMPAPYRMLSRSATILSRSWKAQSRRHLATSASWRASFSSWHRALHCFRRISTSLLALPASIVTVSLI